jgi:hypothetical protein
MDFEALRQRYKPEVIRFLFIAEAPPHIESGRFFYLTEMQTHDALFLETMRVLYPDCSNLAARDLRQQKALLLTFALAGCRRKRDQQMRCSLSQFRPPEGVQGEDG